MSTRKEKKPHDYGAPQYVSEHYAVYPYIPYILFISKDMEVPKILKRDMNKAPDIVGRKPYSYRYKFTSEDNDCLQFSESLAKNVLHYDSEECVYQVKGSTRLFGDTYPKNIELALKYKENEKADPKKGQSYAIVRTNLLQAMKKEAVAPYHIAYVLEEDGPYRVTMEADAGAMIRKPVFGVYSTIPKDPTSFHTVYKEMYGKQHAATIVLQKRKDKI